MSLSPQPVYHRIENSSNSSNESEVAVAINGLEASNESNSYNNEETKTRHLRQRKWAVILLSSCTILLFADQNLMSPNLTAMADYFGFDDDERDRKLGGDIALAFFLLGAPASFVIGFLADFCDRTQLFAATVFAGEGACMATYWTTTYGQLYACRAITGLSVGGALPLIYSILGDMYAAEERHAVSSYVSIGVGAGISFGQGVAGFLGPTFGWRVPFLVISIPALLVAAAVLIIVEDPERGAMEQATLEHRQRQAESSLVDVEMAPLEDEDNNGGSSDLRPVSDDEIVLPTPTRLIDCRKHWDTLQSLLSTPTVILSLLQGGPGCVPWGIVSTYLNDFLAVDRGMSIEFATFVLLVFGFGNFFGMLIGGQGGAYLYRLDKRYPALLAGSSAILSCFPFWMLLNRVDSSSSAWVTGPVAVLAGLASGVTGPIIKATMQNVTLPQSRGLAFALFNTFDDFGRGLGPVFVAIMISRLGGRTPAFNLGVLGWIICGVVNLFVSCTVERDESTVQRLIAESLSTFAAPCEDGDGHDDKEKGA